MENQTKYRRFKRRVFDIIQISNTSDLQSRAFDFFLVVVIAVNILAMFLDTFQFMEPYGRLLDLAEAVTVGIFCVEYLLRLWTAEFLYPNRTKAGAVLRFLYSFDGLVELLTILPFFFLSGAVAFRMMRVVRIFHLFRINANYDSFNVITSVLKEKKNQIISSLFIILVLMLASSLCMYSVEHAAQPDQFKNARSGMWWSVSALLTVGYGDVYPITALGKTMAVLISFLGVGAVAIPTGIISAGFVEQYTNAQSSSASLDSRMMEMRVNLDSKWVGCTVEEIEKEYELLILLVERGKTTLRPDPSFRLKLGDKVGVYFRRQTNWEQWG